MAESPAKAFLTPGRIVRYFNLEPGDHVADFGAGHGYFTLPMAHAVGGNGRVYALDIQRTTLDIIRARARQEHLLNIHFIIADLEHTKGSKIKDQFLEFVVVANTLFQATFKESIIKEAFRVLRPKGRLAVIDWDESPLFIGPPPVSRVKKEIVKKISQDQGFIFDQEFEAGDYHYGLLFRKP